MNKGDPPDMEILQRLPAVLLREGYIDCGAALGTLAPWGPPRPLPLPPPLATLIALFAQGQEVEREALAPVLGAAELAALRRLGVLMERDGRLHTAGLVLVPLMGHLLFVPHPGGAYFGDDMVDLAARLTPPRQARCLDLFAGPGTLSLRLATLAQSVVAVESSPVAAGCAELNLVMNGVADRVAVRVGGLGAVAAGERFGFVSAVPPVLPFPPALAGHPDRGDADDGLLPLRQVLELLPQALHPGGLAQVVALAPGDAEGPRVRDELSRHAEAHGLQIAVSVPAAARMRPGDRLFELMALRCAGLGGLAAEEARRRLLHHLAAARVDRVYRLFLSIQRGGPRPGLQVAPLYS